MSNQLTEDVNTQQHQAQPAEKQPQRPSICYNRKAARWSSHKCRLLLANNSLVPLRTETKCHLFGAILAARTSPRSRSSHCQRQSRVTTSALLQLRVKDTALGQLLVLPTPSLHQQRDWHNPMYFRHTYFNPLSSVQQVFT